MSAVAMQAKVVETLQGLHADDVALFKTVETFGGEFTVESFRRHWNLPPAALVAPLGAVDVSKYGNKVVQTIRWVVAVIHRERRYPDRWDLAAVLADRVVEAVSRAGAWGGTAAKHPTNIRSQNRFSGELDSMGTSIWKVMWEQPVELRAELLDAQALQMLQGIRDEVDVDGDGSVDVTVTVETGEQP